MKTKILIIAATLYCVGLHAQERLKPLHIGDKLPDVLIKHLISYKSESISTRDLKGKLLILDFWATWCVPCIQELPRFDKLQNEFKNEVLILPVTYQKAETVKSFMSQVPSLKGLNLPMVVEDTILHSLFPHNSVPHEIIVNQNGMVSAIVNSSNINSETITSFLEGNPIKLVEKASYSKAFDLEKPFFIDSSGREILLMHRMITRHFNGTSLTQSARRGGENNPLMDNRIMGTNMLLLNMYRLALLERLGGPEEIPNIRVNLQTKMKDKFIYPANSTPNAKLKWELNNTYCYDYYTPLNSGVNMYRLFKEDLDNLLHVSSKLDSQEVDCYILKVVDTTKFASKSIKPIHDLGKNLYVFKKHSFYDIIRRIIPKLNYNLIDETNYNGSVDVSFKPVFDDPKILNNDLNVYGLKIIKGIRKLPFITIKDS